MLFRWHSSIMVYAYTNRISKHHNVIYLIHNGCNNPKIPWWYRYNVVHSGIGQYFLQYNSYIFSMVSVHFVNGIYILLKVLLHFVNGVFAFHQQYWCSLTELQIQLVNCIDTIFPWRCYINILSFSRYIPEDGHLCWFVLDCCSVPRLLHVYERGWGVHV